MAAEAEVVEGFTIEVRVEATNDKSGKATPLDRILIISPETANPLPLVFNEEMQWEPIVKQNSSISLQHFS